MKHVLRLALIAMLIWVVPAFAQDNFGLTDEEVSELAAANTASVDQTQFAFDTEVILEVGGVDTPLDVNLLITGGLDVDNEMAFIDIDGTASMMGQQTPIAAEIRVIGETLYAEATDPTTGESSGWFSIPTDAIGDLADEVSDPAVLGEFADEAGVPADIFENTDMLMGGMAALEQIDPTQFVFLGRQASDAGTTFTFELDVPAFVEDPGVGELVKLGLAESGEQVTDAQFAAGVALVAAALEQTTLNVNQTIGASGLVENLSLVFDSTINPADFGETGDPITSLFSINITVRDYDQPVMVEVPEGAIEVPPSALEGIVPQSAETGGAVAPADPGDTTETTEDAAPAGGGLAVGDTTRVEVPPGGTTDLKLNTGGLVTLEARGIDGADARLAVLDASGSMIAENDDHGSNRTDLGFTDSLIVDVDASAGITVQVGTFADVGGTVELTVVGEGGAADTAPVGDTFAVGDTTTVTIPASNEPVLLSLDTTDTVTIVARGVDGADPVLSILDSAGTELASNDDHSSAIADLNGLDSVIEDFTPSGPVTIEVATFASGGTIEVSVMGPGGDETAEAGGEAAAPVDVSGVSADLPNSYAFSNGVSFAYPDGWEVQSESDVVTVLMAPSGRAFIQVYETKSVFGEGLSNFAVDFFQNTYGSGAATTWGFEYNTSDFQEVEIGGRTLEVLDFTGTQGGEPVEGLVIIIPYDSGGFTYMYTYALPTVPANFDEDGLAVAASISE